MKVKEGYLLREIGDTFVVIPVAERVIEFKGMMMLNSVSAFIWKYLSDDHTYDEVLNHIIDSYEIDVDTAKKDLDNLISKMTENGLMENGQ